MPPIPQESFKAIKKKLESFSELFEHVVEIDISKKQHWSDVLILSTLLEQVLELALRGELNGNKTFKDKLFEFKSPLGDLSSKIKMGFAIGLLEEQAYNGMEIVREIRNLFAHTRHNLSLDNRAIAQKIHDLTKEIWKGHKFDSQNPAQEFVHATGALIYYVVRKVEAKAQS